MEEKKFVTFKKEELGVKEYIKRALGKGRISEVAIEYTPVGEKIVISTNRPGMVIGRGGEKIEELTRVLKKRFKLDNPHIDIDEITEEKLDAQLVADDIAISLERRGSMQFKVAAYRALEGIMAAGALGAEIVLSGKLPSDRSKTWRFKQGYLKKTGDPSKLVHRAHSQAKTGPGVVGIKVSILRPDVDLKDRIIVTPEVRKKAMISASGSEEASKHERVGGSDDETSSRARSEARSSAATGSQRKKTPKKKSSTKKEAKK
ncbi:30S ribosomal protein S3 [Candidatus Pacearchaeota archaeon]|jgi:small subunit ribosomal protein S3|nr:30S ribosomal protein S3 [Candidatus Pacearchaeota archaeon]